MSQHTPIMLAFVGGRKPPDVRSWAIAVRAERLDAVDAGAGGGEAVGDIGFEVELVVVGVLAVGEEAVVGGVGVGEAAADMAPRRLSIGSAPGLDQDR